MSDCACMAHEETRCPCHVPLAQRLKDIGVTLDDLTPTESALVDALLPPGEWRTSERICASVGWVNENDVRTSHLIRTNLARLRPTLHAAGWDVVTQHGSGNYRVIRCRIGGDDACQHAPRYSSPLVRCIDCGGVRHKGREFRRGRRCRECLAKWRSTHYKHEGVPRCAQCGELLASRQVTRCKACRLIPAYWCEDCSTPITGEGTTGLCTPCAARRTLARRRAS